MSAASPAYNKLYIKAWTLLSVTVGLILLAMFVFGQDLLAIGRIVWDVIRYFASPII